MVLPPRLRWDEVGLWLNSGSLALRQQRHTVRYRSAAASGSLGWVGLIAAALAQNSHAHTYSFYWASDPPQSLSLPSASAHLNPPAALQAGCATCDRMNGHVPWTHTLWAHKAKANCPGKAKRWAVRKTQLREESWWRRQRRMVAAICLPSTGLPLIFISGDILLGKYSEPVQGKPDWKTKISIPSAPPASPPLTVHCVCWITSECMDCMIFSRAPVWIWQDPSISRVIKKLMKFDSIKT